LVLRGERAGHGRRGKTAGGGASLLPGAGLAAEAEGGGPIREGRNRRREPRSATIRCFADQRKREETPVAKKKAKLPKKIAGVKLPKFLRKSDLLNALLASATGRELMAKAVTAAAAAAAAVLVEHRGEVAAAGGRALDAGADAAKSGAKNTAKATSLAALAAKSAAGAFAEVVTDAAKGFLPGADKGDGDDGTKKRAKDGGKGKRGKEDRADFLTH
jgi:hypothetical protein